MKLLKAVVGGLMLAAVPLAALAEDMSYSYVDLAYVDTDIDGAPSADGFGLRGAVDFAENFFVFGEYSDQSGGGLDLTSYAVGFGGHYGVAENVDVVGRIGWAQVEVDSGPFNADDDAYLIDLGLRGRIGDAVELEGGARYTDFSDGGDSTGLFVGGRFHFNETWALGAEYQDGDDSSTILAYVRASF
jgi:hypothetical protein